MCIIIYNKNKKPIPTENLERAYKANPDGAGVAFVRKGRVYVGKSVKPEEIKKFISNYNTAGALFHFRIKTHGSIKKENCHPFTVLSKDAGDPIDLVMMHNGILSFTEEMRGKGDDRTDSEIFATDYLRPILLKNPDLLYTPAFISMLESLSGYSKLAFLDSKGRTLIINEKKGEERGGIWYSNKSAFKPEYITPLYTTYNKNFYGEEEFAYLANSLYKKFSIYAENMRKVCKNLGKNKVGYYRWDDKPDQDERLTRFPAHNSKECFFEWKTSKTYIKTQKSLYFFDYISDAWYECTRATPEAFYKTLKNKNIVKA